ncbi:RNA polymerase sigma factor [Lunatibacter salilacus]|uniref:RNA polymerase sigma factor n=1 Tax=Lunatibacter salilacus TaxID=2483804 RepID=UPI00131E0BD3|nr:RNA polymerase sigma factor [Lunatibacter salilacus]
MKSKEEYTDEELVNFINQQHSEINHPDSECLAILYNRYYGKIYNKCISLVKDPSESFDLTEEIFIKIFYNLIHFRGDSSLSTWIYTITQRHCLEFFRKLAKGNTFIMNFELNGNDIPELQEVFEETEDRETLMMGLINQLSEEERDLLLLKYGQGISIERLQEMFKISASAIKMRLKRSRERLNHLYLKAIRD